MKYSRSTEHRSGFETSAGTRHIIYAALARNQEHVGRTFDVGRVLGFLWNDCTLQCQDRTLKNHGSAEPSDCA